MDDKIIPRWFWRLASICLSGIFGTAVLVGWTLGSFMSETQVWQKAQDERFFSHLDSQRETKERMIGAIEAIRETVRRNGEFGAAYKATQDSINRRITRLEDDKDTQDDN